MLLSKASWSIAAFALTLIIITIFSQFNGLPSCYGLSKVVASSVNESGTIVFSGETEGNIPSFGNEQTAIGLCGQSLCRDFYPKDGKIEGQSVTLLNPAGINSVGRIVGLCILGDPAGNYAFVREPDGRFWIFRTPSSTGQGEFTDISDSGNAVGVYQQDSSSAKIGFVMNSRRQWVADIKYPYNPCPDTRAYLHTQPNGINDEGEIVGNYDCTERPDEVVDPLSKGNGFYRAPDGTYYRVQYENASRTVAGKISNLGVIIGYYVIDRDVWIPFAANKEDVIKPVIP
jgi:hypothetical protein